MENKEDKIKLLFLSDSPFINTGFSTQALFTLNGLSDTGKYECYYQSANGYQGQTLPEGNVKLEDGTPCKFTIYGTARENYATDLWSLRLKDLKPAFWITLLDSLPGYRPLIVRNKHLETEILTFEELYDKISVGQEFFILSPQLNIGKER